MSKCVNEHCSKDAHDSPTRVWWGCDGDAACSQECYQAARSQMDHFCSVILPDDRKFADWLGVPEEQIAGAS